MTANAPDPVFADWLTPDWPAPACVRAYVSTRGAPLSVGPYGAFNTADHVDDTTEHVQQSRQRLQDVFAFSHAPIWLDQVHGIAVVQATPSTRRQPADAVTTTVAGLPITIHTADCLPVFFCNRAGSRVALAHAGWRGLLAGVIEQTVQTFDDSPEDLLVWLGPAIGPQHFEVGDEVRQAFIQSQPAHASAFMPSPFQADGKHWLCDIYLLARQRLAQLGIHEITGGDRCTVTEEQFFSFRREKKTGRLLSIIWLQPA